MTQVKKVRITVCTFITANFFTRCSTYGIGSQVFATTASAKVTAPKRSNRAGATPLFCGQSAQKFRWVAPAFAGTSRRPFARLHPRAQEFCQTRCLTLCMK